MSEELKPCPFCGFNDQLYPCHDFPGTGPAKGIDCLRCGIDFAPRDGMDVIAAWNKRSDTSQARLSEAVKVLEQFAEAAECLDDQDHDSHSIWEHAAAMNITAGDLRAAKAFLATLGEENGEP